MSQNPYHYSMNPQHQYPYGMPGEFMDIYEDRRRLMDMYPDIYRRIYPRVQEICHHMDVHTNPRMYPYVDPRMLDEMIDQIYHMEINEVGSEQRRFLRDLITILFIRELLGRRRRHFGRFPYGTYPGYGGFPF
ncbi:hypothetical protein [Alkaliphilus transvaalensis]|uniref:hypothetical protein n=1 Tax=Alkaliphilus transvaalensis TaxID=114628 RepID=UPI00047A6594|nr:hypothetical protein [Alkaliphilus transvaalensis]